MHALSLLYPLHGLTFTLTFWSKPSIWFSSSMRIRCTSLHMQRILFTTHASASTPPVSIPFCKGAHVLAGESCMCIT